MANTKISQLPSYTGSASGSFLVMNDLNNTVTYKVTRETLLGDYTASYALFAISASEALTSSFAHTLDGYHSSVFPRLNIINTFTKDLQVLTGSHSAGTFEGDTFFIYDLEDNAEIGISNHLSDFDGPYRAGIYVSSGSVFNNYRTAIEIPNGANFTHPNGLVNILFPTTITGSLDVTGGITGSILANNGVISSSAQISQSGFVSSSTVQIIEVMTSASYSSITPVSGTLYIIVG